MCWLVGWWIGGLGGWLVGGLHWLVDGVVDWLVGRLVGWFCMVKMSRYVHCMQFALRSYNQGRRPLSELVVQKCSLVFGYAAATGPS